MDVEVIVEVLECARVFKFIADALDELDVFFAAVIALFEALPARADRVRADV